MASYVLRRLLLMVFTIWGVLTITFALVQFVPGGPVERIVAQLQGQNTGATSRISGGGGDTAAATMGGGEGGGSTYRGAQGLDPKFIKSLEAQFGLDKPWYQRYAKMLRDYTCWYHSETPVNGQATGDGGRKVANGLTCFNFGDSYFRSTSIVSLIKEKLPVSISLGLWMTLISYAISIPLGIRKAMRDGSKFDTWTSIIVIVAYAVPGFMVAVAMIVLFAGGSFWQILPLRGLTSDNFSDLSLIGKVLDYLHHLVIPVFAISLASFATLTLLTKNSFLDEIRKQYVLTARMKGLGERQVLYGHVFRNAMLLVIAGFASTFVHAFFAGALLIEVTCSLDGLGLLSYDSIMNRDYPVVLANLYIFSLIGLLLNLISDLTYTWIDPRIDFESRKV